MYLFLEKDPNASTSDSFILLFCIASKDSLKASYDDSVFIDPSDYAASVLAPPDIHHPVELHFFID